MATNVARYLNGVICIFAVVVVVGFGIDRWAIAVSYFCVSKAPAFHLWEVTCQNNSFVALDIIRSNILVLVSSLLLSPASNATLFCHFAKPVLIKPFAFVPFTVATCEHTEWIDWPISSIYGQIMYDFQASNRRSSIAFHTNKIPTTFIAIKHSISFGLLR